MRTYTFRHPGAIRGSTQVTIGGGDPRVCEKMMAMSWDPFTDLNTSLLCGTLPFTSRTGTFTPKENQASCGDKDA